MSETSVSDDLISLIYRFYREHNQYQDWPIRIIRNWCWDTIHKEKLHISIHDFDKSLNFMKRNDMIISRREIRTSHETIKMYELCAKVIAS